MPAVPETERIEPAPTVLTLSSGLQVNVLRLRTRQLFRLLKIVTRGAGPGVIQLLSLDQLTAENAADFGVKLATVVLLSIPEAEQEALQFIASMVEPVGLIKRDGPSLNKQDGEYNDRLWSEMNNELVNPEIEDTLDIIQAIVEQEAPELERLGKRIAQMMRLATKTGQDKTGTPEPPPGNQELAQLPDRTSTPVSQVTRSAEPSLSSTTSSPASTAGETPSSETSRSAASTKSLIPSSAGGSGSSGNASS